jgi:uncharacterized protein
MNSKKSNSEISKAQTTRLFQEGHDLAFEPKKRSIPWRKVFELWSLAASGGHTRAQFYLGTCYDFGNGTKKDTAQAFKWYMIAPRKGKMEAQFNVGF